MNCRSACRIAVLGILTAAATSSAGAQSLSAGARVPSSFGRSYDSLDARQKALLSNLFGAYKKFEGKDVDPKVGFEANPVSVRSTFDAVTHALLHTELTDAEGKSLGDALALVEEIEAVNGKVRGARGDLQFRLYAVMRPLAVEVLSKSREFLRDRDNSHFHRGYPVCFRQAGLPSIQVSLSRDGRRADIDVDYRSSRFPKSVVNGHLTAGNSDVRAGSNFQGHLGRWEGLNAWWREVLDFEQFRLFFEELLGQPLEQTEIPVIPPKGKAKIQEAAFDFLDAWLVRDQPNLAVSYVSKRYYGCAIDKMEAKQEGVEFSMAPLAMSRRLRQLRRQLGPFKDLSEVLVGVRITDAPEFRFVAHKNQGLFGLYDVPESWAYDFSCPAAYGNEDVSKGLASKRHGQYYVAVLRAPGADAGESVWILWNNEAGIWRVLDIQAVPDPQFARLVTPPPAEEAAPKVRNYPAPVELISATGEFMREWFQRRNYDRALSFFEPESLACAAIYMEPPAPTDFAAFRSQLRRGMVEISRALGRTPNLESALTPVDLANADLPISPHPGSRYYTVFALPDAVGEAFACKGRTDEHLRIPQAATAAEPSGNYFVTSFILNAPGDDSAAISFLWRKIGNVWRISALHVTAP